MAFTRDDPSYRNLAEIVESPYYRVRHVSYCLHSAAKAHTMRSGAAPPTSRPSPEKTIQIAVRPRRKKHSSSKKINPVNSNPHIKTSTSESFSLHLSSAPPLTSPVHSCPAPLIPLYQVPSSPVPAPLEKCGTRGRIPQETQGSTRVCLHRIAHGKTGIEGCRDIGCCWCAGAAAWCTGHPVDNRTTTTPESGLFVTPYRTYPALTSPLLSLSYPISSLYRLLSILSLLPTTEQLPLLHKPNTTLKLPANNCQTN